MQEGKDGYPSCRPPNFRYTSLLQRHIDGLALVLVIAPSNKQEAVDFEALNQPFYQFSFGVGCEDSVWLAMISG